MGVQIEDRTTIDMFAERQRGRPKSNPYPRDVQVRVNKRTQRQRDRRKGLHRLEVKMPADLVKQIDEYAALGNCTRAEIIETSVADWLRMVLDAQKEQADD